MEISFKGEFGFFISTVSHSQWRVTTAHQRTDSIASSHPFEESRPTTSTHFTWFRTLRYPFLLGKGATEPATRFFPYSSGGRRVGRLLQEARASDHLLISQAQKTLGLCPFGMCLSALCDTKTGYHLQAILLLHSIHDALRV
jgi:hypothetical protein